MTDNQSNSYQDILDKYAESISSKDNPEIPQEKIIPEPELEPITPPEPILTSEEETLLKSEPSVEPETVLNPPQIEAPPVTEAITSPDIPETIISPPPQIELPLEPSEPMPKKENHFFKYLFFFSLIIFIIVLVLVIISFLNSQKPISNSRDIPKNNLSPTSLPVTFCEINDQKHAVGTTFSANDSCNTCTCGQDLTINCTTKTCDATPSVKLSPTKSATVSATPSVIKLNYSVPVSYKKISDIANSFEVAYDPAEFAKVNSEDSRVLLSFKDNRNTIDIKLLPYDNGSRHTFLQKNGNFSKTPQTKEVEYNISGKSGLFDYNVDASGTYAVGMVVASSTKAWIISTTSGDQTIIESVISTLKLL